MSYTPWLLLLASYLIGAIPSSYIGGRMVRGIDLRAHGSGNLGATNTFRVLGWRTALPVLLFDMGKGFLPTYSFPLWDGTPAETWALAYGAGAVLGHVFSPYVAFRGGKGVATSAGMLLALAWPAMLSGLVVWLLVVFASRIVSLASLAAAAVVPVIVWWLYGIGPTLWLCVALAVFVVFAHRSNIGRLVRGQETRFGQKSEQNGGRRP